MTKNKFEGYSNLLEIKHNQSSGLIYLPHVRQKIEQVFSAWQEDREAAANDGIPIISYSSELPSVAGFNKKITVNSCLDSKQPFRPEQRYRRR